MEVFLREKFFEIIKDDLESDLEFIRLMNDLPEYSSDVNSFMLEVQNRMKKKEITDSKNYIEFYESFFGKSDLKKSKKNKKANKNENDEPKEKEKEDEKKKGENKSKINKIANEHQKDKCENDEPEEKKEKADGKKKEKKSKSNNMVNENQFEENDDNIKNF